MFRIDNQSRQAVYEQIVEQIEKYILSGILTDGDQLPSVRKLSVQLTVNPNTVQRAYTELERSGVIVTAPGRGAFVCEAGIIALKTTRRAQHLLALEKLVLELNQSNVEKQEILEVVNGIYQGGKTHD